jgi:hypothetical protein
MRRGSVATRGIMGEQGAPLPRRWRAPRGAGGRGEVPRRRKVWPPAPTGEPDQVSAPNGATCRSPISHLSKSFGVSRSFRRQIAARRHICAFFTISSAQFCSEIRVSAPEKAKKSLRAPQAARHLSKSDRPPADLSKCRRQRPTEPYYSTARVACTPRTSSGAEAQSGNLKCSPTVHQNLK